MEKRKLSWESLIRRCPHCDDPLRIHHVSSVSDKHLIDMIYQSLHKHYIEDCLDHELPKPIEIEVEVESQLGSYAKYFYNQKYKLIV